MEILIQIVYVIIGILLYFLPSIIAYNQYHYKLKQLFLINLLLGWSGIAWIIVLVWAIVPNIFKGRV